MTNLKKNKEKKILLQSFSQFKSDYLTNLRLAIRQKNVKNEDFQIDIKAQSSLTEDFKRENLLLSEETKILNKKLAEMLENHLKITKNLVFN